jgi:deoxyadenosine/deoxycytidine kinase
MTPAIYSIEGNIGSGKSTLLSLLDKQKKLNKYFLDNVVYLSEPVETWSTIKDTAGMPILEKFYKDQTKYAFSFQMMAYISRLSQLRNAIKTNPYAIFITERSVYTDKNVFAKMLYDDNKIEKVNYDIYLKWFDEFVYDIPLNGIIYVKTDPKICSSRIKERNRQGETIPLEYSNQCHKYHEEWIHQTKHKVLTLDGNQSSKTHVKEEWLDKIKAFLHPVNYTVVNKNISFDDIVNKTFC